MILVFDVVVQEPGTLLDTIIMFSCRVIVLTPRQTIGTLRGTIPVMQTEHLDPCDTGFKISGTVAAHGPT